MKLSTFIHLFKAFSLSLVAATSVCAEPTQAQGFCALNSETHPEHGDAMWGAASVQHYIRQLLQKDQVRDRAVAAYAVTYLKMTERRDQERCGGMLSADDTRSEAIGDLLADLMSRWMILETDACSQDTALARSATIGLCRATQHIVASDVDTMGAALETTSAYLSSHMSKALAAVILSDRVWRDYFPEAYHCPTSGTCSSAVRKARLDAIRAYKKLYDKNNGFLAQHASTVITTLREACYLKAGPLTAGARLIDLLPFNKDLFKIVRDKTFFTAIQLAETMTPAEHPMLKYEPGQGWLPQFAEYRDFRSPPAVLLRLEATAKHLFASGAIHFALRPLGSVTQDELTMIQPSQSRSCRYPGP